MFSHYLLPFLEWNRNLSLFFGSFLVGEVSVIGASFLAGQGKIPLIQIFIASLAGTFTFDILIFSIARWFRSFPGFQAYHRKHSEAFETATVITGKNPLLILLYSKFLHGTRTISLALLADREISFPKFLLADIGGTLIWLVTSMAIGYFAGKGVHGLRMFERRIEFILTGVFLLIVAIRVIRYRHNKRQNKNSA